VSYTSVFGGTSISPAQVSYASYALTAGTSPLQLRWPTESSGPPPVASIIDVTGNAASLALRMPNATLVSPGETVLFNNVGLNDVVVQNAAGTPIVTIAPGSAWQIYLTGNTTAAGAWRVFQYGASVSVANAAALAGAGIKAISTTLNQSVPIISFSSSGYITGVNDRAALLLYSGTAGSLVPADASTLGADWFVLVRNAGSGALTIDPTGPQTINGFPTISLQPGDSCFVICDGASFFTVGLGQNATFAFDYTAINVSGGGPFVLTGTQLNRIAYRFTGALIANREIIVPTTVQQYWVTNATTGAFTLTVKTAAGTGVTVAQGASAILYSDGTNVVPADTAGLSVPISIAQGGTGATTAGAALINLGGTSTGISVFQAASQVAARGAIGITVVGDAVVTSATQAAARTAIGITPVGDALVTAANQAAAWAALGVAQAGNVDGGSF
jgi:hypothetical protein